MQRGRRYARAGQVLSLDVESGVLAATVQGSRPSPYSVTIGLAPPSAAQWSGIEKAMSAKVGFVARLLAGEVPPDLEDVFRAAGVPLFPRSYRELRTNCSCPDWEDPCKHLAAVLYVFADQLDADPWLILAWRGRTRASYRSWSSAVIGLARQCTCANLTAQADRTAWSGHRPLLDPGDRQRLALAGARRRLHLLARLGRGHRLDRPQPGLGHDAKDFLDLRMQARHGLSP